MNFMDLYHNTFGNYSAQLTVYLLTLWIVQVPLFHHIIKSNDNHIPSVEHKGLIEMNVICFGVCLVSMVNIFYISDSETVNILKQLLIWCVLLAVYVRLIFNRLMRQSFLDHPWWFSSYMLICVFVSLLPFMLFAQLSMQIMMLNSFLGINVIIFAVLYGLMCARVDQSKQLASYYLRGTKSPVLRKLLQISCFINILIFQSLIFNIPCMSSGSGSSYELTGANKEEIICKLLAAMLTYMSFDYYLFKYKRFPDFRGLNYLHEAGIWPSDGSDKESQSQNVVSIEKFYIVSAQDLN